MPRREGFSLTANKSAESANDFILVYLTDKQNRELGLYHAVSSLSAMGGLHAMTTRDDPKIVGIYYCPVVLPRDGRPTDGQVTHM